MYSANDETPFSKDNIVLRIFIDYIIFGGNQYGDNY